MLLATAILIGLLASYLIYVGIILWQVIDRLNTILAGVVAVREQSEPIGPVANAINADLEAGHKVLDAAVARVAEKAAERAAEAEPVRRWGFR